MIIGIVIVISGIIFYLQGNSVVGPEYSFMYSSPEWITYGLEIIILGAVVTVGGFGLSVYIKN